MKVLTDYASDIFSYTYIILIVLCLITSFAVPVDRGIGIFRFLMFFFGVVMTFTMGAIIYYMAKSGVK